MSSICILYLRSRVPYHSLYLDIRICFLGYCRYACAIGGIDNERNLSSRGRYRKSGKVELTKEGGLTNVITTKVQ